MGSQALCAFCFWTALHCTELIGLDIAVRGRERCQIGAISSYVLSSAVNSDVHVG